MEQIILIFHFFIAIVLIVLVLVQKGKGANIGAAFGSGASTTVFGSKGSGGFLMKLTIFVAALFFGTSMFLTYLAANQAKSSQSNVILTNVAHMAKLSKQEKTSNTAVTTKKSTAKKLSVTSTTKKSVPIKKEQS